MFCRFPFLCGCTVCSWLLTCAKALASPAGHGPARARPVQERALWRAAACSPPWCAGWSRRRWSFRTSSDEPPAAHRNRLEPASDHLLLEHIVNNKARCGTHHAALLSTLSPRWRRPSWASEWRALPPPLSRPAANQTLHSLPRPCRWDKRYSNQHTDLVTGKYYWHKGLQ